MPHRNAWIVALLGLLLGPFLSPLEGAAQETPPPETSSAATIQEPLFQAVLESLPEPPAFVRLVRTTLAPGAGVPLHSHPGPAFNLVETGLVTIEVEGPAVVAPGGDVEAAGQAPVGEAFDLASGDQIVYPAGTSFAFANESDEPIRLLSLLVVPAGDDRPPVTDWPAGTPSSDDLSGVSDTILGQAVSVAWPPAPLLIVADRLAIGPGQSVPPSGGPVMLAVETGSLDFSVLDGAFQISRGQDDLEAINTPTGSYRANEGDAVFFPTSSSAVPRSEDDALLVLVRLSILPVSDETESGSSENASEDDDEPTPGGADTGPHLATANAAPVSAESARHRGPPPETAAARRSASTW